MKRKKFTLFGTKSSSGHLAVEKFSIKNMHAKASKSQELCLEALLSKRVKQVSAESFMEK